MQFTVKLQQKQEIEELNNRLSELKVKEEQLPDVLESYQRQVNIAKQELLDKQQGKSVEGKREGAEGGGGGRREARESNHRIKNKNI